MYGVNAGYDSRPMNTGDADSGVTLYDKEDVFFQQVAAGLEAVSDTWNFNAYALIPVGDTEQRLNSRYLGGALDTNGLDVGYFITPVSMPLLVITTSKAILMRLMVLACKSRWIK